MKLIIREYLSLMKESEELDSMLSDLLLSMDIEPLSKPQRGVRQYGVDIAGIGIDPEDQVKKVFLFVIKQKDIDRSSWDSGPQAVRPSLNEIFDVYIQTMISSDFKHLPKKIIVATNGDLAQTIQMNWKMYIDERRREGEIEFDFWGGDKLSILIQEYLFNEYLFPQYAQSYLRKTLAFIDLNDYDLSHYFKLIDETLFQRELTKEKDRLKVIRLLHLSLNLIFLWSDNADNLKPALLSAERVILRVWDWLIKNNLIYNDKMVNEFLKLESTRSSINNAYFNKIQKYCYIKDGLSGYGAEEIEYPMLIFEQIGILSIMGLDCIYKSMFFENERNNLIENAKVVSDALIKLIKNNKASLYPLLDGHSNDINIALVLLFYLDKKDEMKNWLFELINHIFLNYRFNRRFPILSDSYEELIDIELNDLESKTESSTLIPIILEWAILLDFEQLYVETRDALVNILPKLNLQIWYPDDDSENFMYHTNALYESGSMRTSIDMPENFNEFKDQVLEEKEQHGDPQKFSFFSNGYLIIGLLSSRHFRTPVFPEYWRRFIT
ncbi:hypothetical protein [Paenibacillus hexagrammi]|uniref:Uncharacterized protein n=1 Tax=Paenibacillus hexagrammi TaxID=2908839 RepID=A0ABY3SKX9_9BACL|nr:hypothetical protein [Paenibacillus sp. YPD9-1]UJF33736.1 hypothetical protein L0M14_00250 [Paenibacillus sp. YPD9-1]